MISVAEALHMIEQNVTVNTIVLTQLTHALGTVLAEDITSPIDMPPFRQSSMDGYAVIGSNSKTYKVIAEVQAGISEDVSLNAGEAVRIFTGARIPDNADTIIIQEHTQIKADKIFITKPLQQFQYIRPIGEQLKKGEIALRKGMVLNEAGIGFLAGLGIASISTYQQPKVSILITGNELQKTGETLKEGQIYESNSITLLMALKRMGIEEVAIDFVKDDYCETVKVIGAHLKMADVILISGGISVGDYDFVKGALETNQVEEHFYKVNQKPGKPLWFGSKNKTSIFALPGNPASSLTCFYVYVAPAVRKMLGHKNFKTQKKQATTESRIENKFSKTLFLKGMIEDNVLARPLYGQESSMLKSFTEANALLIVPENIEVINKGETIHYIDLLS